MQWVGVRFTLNEDAIILGLPDKLMSDLLQVLKSWANAGMAPIKELRQVAGRTSWVSGILPRTRWVVAVFYRVLHERLNDIASGKEEERRQHRRDDRAKGGLFVVKQLEQPRVWLIKYLEVAMTKPTRRLKLDTMKYPKATIVTDASPLGAGRNFAYQQPHHEGIHHQSDAQRCQAPRIRRQLGTGSLSRDCRDVIGVAGPQTLGERTAVLPRGASSAKRQLGGLGYSEASVELYIDAELSWRRDSPGMRRDRH